MTIKKHVLVLWLGVVLLVPGVYAASVKNKVVALAESSSSSDVASEGDISDIDDDSNVITDPSKLIKIDKAHSIFKIILRSNRSTGYSWSLKDYDKNLISLKKSEYKPKSRCNYEGMCATGVAGVEKWVFKALLNNMSSSKTTKITLVYSRPWDKGASNNEETFNIELVPGSAD